MKASKPGGSSLVEGGATSSLDAGKPGAVPRTAGLRAPIARSSGSPSPAEPPARPEADLVADPGDEPAGDIVPDGFADAFLATARPSPAPAAPGPDDSAEPVGIDDVATAVVDAKGSGEPVDAGLRAQVGAAVGAELPDVRVHRDELSQLGTAAIGARAFAYGQDVFLGPGESPSDTSLMAHELAHVAQQDAGRKSVQRRVEVGAVDSPAERHADAVAARVVSGEHSPLVIVDDSAAEVGPGQMRRTEFLAQLEPAVTAAASDELGPFLSAAGCPYIARYFATYRGRSARECEEVLRRFTRSQATTATALVPDVVTRVRAGVRHWRDTGAAPPEVVAFEPAAAQAIPPGAAAQRSPLADLGDGQPLNGTAAARIGGAMGEDFSGVRVHTGAVAARAAASADAAAFTFGRDIVFAAGTYQPGTPRGDALLAHELAHVAQQRGAEAARSTDGGAPATSPAHEEDADAAARGVLGRLYAGARKALRALSIESRRR